MRRPRRQPPYRPPAASQRLYLRLPSRQVALLTFLLEARDNLALPTVVDRFAAVVRLLYAPQAAAAVEAFVRDFAAVCPEARICWRPALFPIAKTEWLD
ncbi:MAG: DUF4911 domain-containing protein [Solidesulfovibrio sp. DCME]|uniref:DUF4911 domain-containing protein n=1 Tax=Solidesulfovibrio sp. DCME TaxID=3447380 RepID=UPI003D0E8C35